MTPGEITFNELLARAISEINYQSLLIIFKWHLLIHED